MLSTEDQENIDVQTVRATKAAIRLAMTDESILASPRERQRWAVALSAHAIAACRRDRSTARFLGGRIRSLEGFCMRASVALFGKQTPTKQGLFARAIRRIAEEQLDTKSTLALLSRVGLVGFTRGLSKPDTSELSLSPLGLIKVNDFLDAFMKTYPRHPTVTPSDFNTPASLVLVQQDDTGQTRAVIITDKLDRIYTALKATHLPCSVTDGRSA